MATPPRTAIRAKIAANGLPARIPLRARVITPDRGACDACDRPLAVGPVWELEFPGRRTIRLHNACEGYWRAETQN